MSPADVLHLICVAARMWSVDISTAMTLMTLAQCNSLAQAMNADFVQCNEGT